MVPRTRTMWRVYGFTVYLAILGLTPAANAAQTLVLNDPTFPPYTTDNRNGYLDKLTAELGRRVGVQFKLVRLPTERGLISANEGMIDGDLSRVEGMEKAYPHLLPLLEKNMDMHFVGLVRGLAPVNQLGWDRLAGKRVGMIKGWKIFEKNVPRNAEVTYSNDADQLIQLLAHNRIDIALYETEMGVKLAHEKGLHDVQPLAPALVVKPMFIYLNKKHQDLIPPLSAALRAMRADGTLARLMSATLKRSYSAR